MSINLNHLVKHQEVLDSRIFSEHKTSREATFRERILALYVELGELANEIRSFKYWSLKKDLNHDAILEEFSDVLHFTLSLGIDINYSDYRLEAVNVSEGFSEVFLLFYESIINFSKDRSSANYKVILENLGKLSVLLELKQDDIDHLYRAKNAKNHERQKNNY